MNDIILEEQPFRVLRVVPKVPIEIREGLLGFVDMIHVDYKLLLLNCELLGPPGPYVRFSDWKLLLQYHLHPGSQYDLTAKMTRSFWGIDLQIVMDQMMIALNGFLGLPKNPESLADWVVNGPFVSDAWKEWMREASREDQVWNELFLPQCPSRNWHESLLGSFLESPAWEEWIETHKNIPTLEDAFVAFVTNNGETLIRADLKEDSVTNIFEN